MQKDLLVGMGMEEEDEADDEDSQECEQPDIESANIGGAVEELRKHVEQVILEDEDKTTKGTSQAAAYSVTDVVNLENNIECSSSGCESSPPKSTYNITTASEDLKFKSSSRESESSLTKSSEKHRESVETRERNVSECVSDVCSIRSARTNGLSTASTIAPEVIKKRVQVALNKRDRQTERKRILAKGEASATTRSRRDNAKTIKESHGVWGWD